MCMPFPLIFSESPVGKACPLGCSHFTFSTMELCKDSNTENINLGKSFLAVTFSLILKNNFS